VKWKLWIKSWIIYFTAHSINCVCQRVRSMFIVLGIYNFVKILRFPKFQKDPQKSSKVAKFCKSSENVSKFLHNFCNKSIFLVSSISSKKMFQNVRKFLKFQMFQKFCKHCKSSAKFLYSTLHNFFLCFCYSFSWVFLHIFLHDYASPELNLFNLVTLTFNVSMIFMGWLNIAWMQNSKF
jgi:hypothetical protein